MRAVIALAVMLGLGLGATSPAQAQAKPDMLALFNDYAQADAFMRLCLRPTRNIVQGFGNNYRAVSERAGLALQARNPKWSKGRVEQDLKNRAVGEAKSVAGLIKEYGCNSRYGVDYSRLFLRLSTTPFFQL